MSLGQADALTFVAVGCLLLGRSPNDRIWRVPGFVLLGTIVFALVRYGFHAVVLRGPSDASAAFAAVLMGSLFLAQAVGLPRRFACLLGIGIKSRPLQFSNRLMALVKLLGETVNLVGDDPDRRREALTKADDQVRRMRSLRPPDSAWRRLQDDLAEGFAGSIDALRIDAPTESIADRSEAIAQVVARWGQMQEEAAQDQRLLNSPVRRRRAQVVWFATAGVSLLLLGYSQVRGQDLFTIGARGPISWETLALLALGGIALVGSIVVALRGSLGR
jgi:hypothetical protein